MKKNLHTISLICCAAGAFAQGQINLDNLENQNNSPTATSGGKFFFFSDGVGLVLANQDFNVSFYGGSDVNSLVHLRIFSRPSAVGSNAFGPGTFVDPLGVAATIPGASTTAFFRIEAWTGTSWTYADAFDRGSSPVFSNPIATPPNTPPGS